MIDWDAYKKGFDAWENTTATYLEKVTKSPMMLGPTGALLAQALKLKAVHGKVVGVCLRALGLPSRRDQERTLAAVHRLEGRLLDMEEKLGVAGATKEGE